MRLIRHIALAAGAVALTGCGLHSTSADTSPGTASSTPAVTTPAATDSPTDAPTDIPTSASPTATSPTAGAPTASTQPSGTSTGSGADTAVIRYSDKTGLLQLPVSNAAIPDAPAGLRDFARTQLKKMWHDQFQDAPGCEGIAQVWIKRATQTAAYVDEGWGATTPTCPQYAGNPSSWAVWGTDGGTWSITLEGAGLAACADLVSHHIPRAIYPTCSNGTAKVPNPVA